MATAKELQEQRFRQIHEEAHAAGMAAGDAVNPEPMNLRNTMTGETYTVTEGPCGFAWVVVRPGNHPYANFLKKNDLGRSGYGGGVHLWVGEFNQSMARKEAYAQAYAATLARNQIPASWSSRLD